jgi:hypothetical protein
VVWGDRFRWCGVRFSIVASGWLLILCLMILKIGGHLENLLLVHLLQPRLFWVSSILRYFRPVSDQTSELFMSRMHKNNRSSSELSHYLLSLMHSAHEKFDV